MGSGMMAAHYEWRLLDELEPDRMGAVQAAIADLLARHPRSTLDHDPDWLAILTGGPGRAVRCYVCFDSQGSLIGYAPFFVHPSAFSLSFGGCTFWSYPIRRLALTAQPLDWLEPESAESAAVALVERLRRDLRGREVVFLLGLQIDSALARVMEGPLVRRQFQVVASGPVYQRRLARVGRSLDDYLARLGAETRRSLRRQERRLQHEAGHDVTLSVHANPDSIPDFLAAAEHVSRRTYQWNLLDMGIRNDESRRDSLRAAALKRWFRGYVLHCRAEPVAFMIGYLYRGVYLATATGYDPAWSEWSAGNVLYLYIMRDLSTLDGAAQWFDFMYGDTPNKERLSTASRPERNCYLVPRTPRWTLLVAVWRGFDGCAGAMSRVLDRLGFKDRVRRLLRDRSTRASRRDTPAVREQPP